MSETPSSEATESSKSDSNNVGGLETAAEDVFEGADFDTYPQNQTKSDWVTSETDMGVMEGGGFRARFRFQDGGIRSVGFKGRQALGFANAVISSYEKMLESCEDFDSLPVDPSEIGWVRRQDARGLAASEFDRGYDLGMEQERVRVLDQIDQRIQEEKKSTTPSLEKVNVLESLRSEIRESKQTSNESESQNHRRNGGDKQG